MRCIFGPDGAENPVAMTALKEYLLARFWIDGPKRIIGATEGQLFAVERPTRAVDRIKRHGQRKFQLHSSDVPELHLAESARIAAGGSQHFAVGRECERLNALRQADQASDEARAIGLVE